MKLAILAGRPAIIREGRALNIAAASEGKIEPQLALLSDRSPRDGPRHLGHVSRPSTEASYTN
jgi:hypothetical protein